MLYSDILVQVLSCLQNQTYKLASTISLTGEASCIDQRSAFHKSASYSWPFYVIQWSIYLISGAGCCIGMIRTSFPIRFGHLSAIFKLLFSSSPVVSIACPNKLGLSPIPQRCFADLKMSSIHTCHFQSPAPINRPAFPF